MLCSVGVANCPFYAGYSLCVQARWDGRKVSVLRSRGCPLFRGFNVLKSMEIRSGQSQVTVISWVSDVDECPFSRVPLYKACIMSERDTYRVKSLLIIMGMS